MKRIVLLSVAATFSCSISFAKVWRVNNNNGVTADFTTAQAANDAATVLAGDTIHLEPSLTSYGSLNCTKRLTWISTGAFPTLYPNEQFSQNVGKLDLVTAQNSGSANSVFHIYTNSNLNLQAPGIRVDRCYVGGYISINNNSGIGLASNIIVKNSYVVVYIDVQFGSNHIITNNIVGSAIGVGAPVPQAIITHNTINALSASVGIINNSIVENNIFNKTTSYTFINSTVQYNMAGVAGVLPAGNNNQNSVTMSNVFINNNGTDDAAFVLKAGSPAISAGSVGVNLGAFGGTSPFKLGMQPAIPAIYKISAPAAPAGNTLNVTFSTRSNN